MTKHPWIGRKLLLRGVPVKVVDVRESHYGDQFKIDDGTKERWVTADNFRSPPKYTSPESQAGMDPIAELGVIERKRRKPGLK